jgi:formate dehydrogenase major subunit
LDDRYRGISGGRRVILVHPEDLAELGFQDRDLVDVVSTFRGHDRQADKFRLVAYPTAKSCAAGISRRVRLAGGRHCRLTKQATP